MAQQETTPETRRCPVCGKPQTQWTENQGQGIKKGDHVYCSRECATQPDTLPAAQIRRR